MLGRQAPTERLPFVLMSSISAADGMWELRRAWMREMSAVRSLGLFVFDFCPDIHREILIKTMEMSVTLVGKYVEILNQLPVNQSTDLCRFTNILCIYT